ncbi:hypothetical protein Ocin01_20007 [Orchesella cincta]|uniref:Uncharacterized protein n=1 Tax=Orchesella cincta TaxID=48709 RepID=A0A1D2M133_ORCCI|nr:hypothetical protein Ocin01_20007 [Orchesella cincta]
MMKRTNFLLAVACCILFVSDLCVSPIHGIQCYICENCPDPVDEHTCKPRHTLCAVAEYKSGKITRDCLSIDDKEEDEKVGTKCDEFNGDPHSDGAIATRICATTTAY